MDTNRVVKKYLVLGFPYFETRMFFIPNDIQRSYESLVKMRLYDPDGALINEIKMIVSSKAPLILDLENFMGDCKPVSGVKFGTLICEMDSFIESYLRLQSKKSGVYVSSLTEFNNKLSTFFPLNFSKNRNTVLMLLNQDFEDVSIEYRILKGNRAPLRTISLERMSSRIIFLNEVFDEILNEINEEYIQAYLKLTILSGNSVVGAQLIDYNLGNNEGEITSIA